MSILLHSSIARTLADVDVPPRAHEVVGIAKHFHVGVNCGQRLGDCSGRVGRPSSIRTSNRSSWKTCSTSCPIVQARDRASSRTDTATLMYGSGRIGRRSMLRHQLYCPPSASRSIDQAIEGVVAPVVTSFIDRSIVGSRFLGRRFSAIGQVAYPGPAYARPYISRVGKLVPNGGFQDTFSCWSPPLGRDLAAPHRMSSGLLIGGTAPPLGNSPFHPPRAHASWVAVAQPPINIGFRINPIPSAPMTRWIGPGLNIFVNLGRLRISGGDCCI